MNKHFEAIVGGKFFTPKDQERPYSRYIAPIVLADHSHISVQIGKSSYARPKNNYGPYTHVEVGLLDAPDSWAEYVEDEFCYVYAFVPVEMVREYIESHGGEAYLLPCRYGEHTYDLNMGMTEVETEMENGSLVVTERCSSCKETIFIQRLED